MQYPPVPVSYTHLVQSIAEVIIKNTSNANERQDFWEKAELNLLMALTVSYTHLDVYKRQQLFRD